MVVDKLTFYRLLVISSLLAQPDPYLRAPLIALLPVLGNLSKLEGFTSSLYARFEKVKALYEGCPEESPQFRKLSAEIGMLTQVLDWLSVQPENNSEGGRS